MTPADRFAAGEPGSYAVERASGRATAGPFTLALLARNVALALRDTAGAHDVVLVTRRGEP